MPTLLSFLLMDKLTLLLKTSDRLCGEFTTTPLVHLFLILLKEVSIDGVNEAGELLPVFWLDLTKGDAACGGQTDDLTEASLGLDNAVRDFKLAAEGWEPNNELDWVDIMGNDDELSLLGLDKGGDILDAVGESLASANFGWSKGLLGLLSGGLKALLMLFLALWAVLLEETEDLDSRGLVKGVVELVHGWWNLEALHEDAALALEADILRPLDAGCGVGGDLSGLVSEEELLLLDVGIEDNLLGLSGPGAATHSERPDITANQVSNFCGHDTELFHNRKIYTSSLGVSPSEFCGGLTRMRQSFIATPRKRST